MEYDKEIEGKSAMKGDSNTEKKVKELEERIHRMEDDYAKERKRHDEIMKEKGLTDITRVGLYGLTYKENVDDFRESPTLQLLEAQERHLARPLKCYDPFLENRRIAENQFDDFDQFLDGVDMVVIMVRHEHIRRNWDKLKGKIILDCFNVCPLEGVYHL